MTTELYGGAIVSAIPQGFIDLSDLREVPNSQEVFVTMEDGADESLIFDLLERMPATDDASALKKHVAEQASLNESAESSRVIYRSNAKTSSDYPSYISMSVSEAKKWGRESEKEIKPVLLVVNGLIRLEKVETDVLISFNLPTETDEATQGLKGLLEQLFEKEKALPVEKWTPIGSYGINVRIKRALDIVNNAIDRFKVEDWGLFD